MKRRYDAVIPGMAGVIAGVNRRFNKAIDEAAKPKKQYVLDQIEEVSIDVVRWVEGICYEDITLQCRVLYNRVEGSLVLSEPNEGVVVNDIGEWYSDVNCVFLSGEVIPLAGEEGLEAKDRAIEQLRSK